MSDIDYLESRGWTENPRSGHWIDPLGKQIGKQTGLNKYQALTLQRQRDKMEQERLAMWNAGVARRAEAYHVMDWWE